MLEREELERLVTVRDWLRFAITRFNAADLVYGHGTASALDEAAYIILHTLHLDIADIAPWLDAHLLPSERRAILGLIERRIATRKPAAYLTNEAYVQGQSFYVDERVIVPRSYIGELLGGGLAGVVPDPDAVTRVLDLCTGSGCLAILAALAFPNAKIDASDLSTDALAVAERNVREYDLADRILLLQSDLFARFAGRQYDLVLANPPYVSDAVVAAFPPEYAAEPRMAHAGGCDGLDIVRRILSGAGEHLTATGSLVCEVGTGGLLLEKQHPDLPFLWLETAESEGEVFALPTSALRPARGDATRHGR
jgi:ribosomal protein L3 glutamine methyltransferase